MVSKAAAAKAAEPQLPAVFNDDMFTAALREHGFLSAAGGSSDFNRIKVSGQNFVYGTDEKGNDNIIASYNPVTKEPAMYVRIAGQPTEYQKAWFDKDGALARAVGRPEMAGKMCKSHFDDPNEARKFAMDGTSCDTCPIHPFVPKDQLPEEAKGKKCAWNADVEFYILDKQPDGTLKQEDDTLYTLSLSTTGVIEFKGSSSKKTSPLAGSVSDMNFMVKLAKLGMEKWGEPGILKAMSYFNLGGVVAELRSLPASSGDGAFKYNVTSFNPIDILEIEEATALPGPAAVEGDDPDDVPF
jgi:hypothetical protein